MKLLSRALLLYTSATLFSLLVIGFVLGISIRHILLKQVSESLLAEKELILREIEKSDSLPDFSAIFNHHIEVTRFPHGVKSGRSFVDSLLTDPSTGEKNTYRFLVVSGNTAQNKGYRIVTSQSVEEEKDRLFEILGMLILLFVILSIGLIFLLSKASGRLWNHFFRTLAAIKQFDIRHGGKFTPVKTPISEFSQLNEVLKGLTERVSLEYLSLKEFSENASHEIQTPLSVIRLKIDQLLQAPVITGEMAEQLISISDAANRISRINQSLTLLSRIENRFYNQAGKVNLNTLIRNILEQFQDFMESKGIRTTFTEEATVDIEANPDLAEVMVTNLINNSIRHNIQDGWVRILLGNQLVIENAGTDPGVDPSRLFGRFVKAGNAADSTGLGLSLVQKIAELYGFGILYTYADGVHRIEIALK